MDMKKLPIGIQSFKELIGGGYLYIDKTRDIHNLLTLAGKYYFLSRPRRFGKSLLVSTLKEVFSGNRELFKGLWIYDKIPWQKHPVIHLDFTRLEFDEADSLKQSIITHLDKIAAVHKIQLDAPGYKSRFDQLIEKLSQFGQVVILIDEYDKPIINHIENLEVAEANRDVLKNLFGVLKGLDEYIRFVFLTGVSKFARVSIFSDLNNLNDITIDDCFATLLGYTQDELTGYFSHHIDALSKKMGLSREHLLEQLKLWYNGYSWDGRNFLYNPFSILNLFQKKRFRNYWFATGTPTFLVNHIRSRNQNIQVLENIEVDDAVFESYDINNLEVVPLLFQTGYLTIKEITITGVKESYRLSYPNLEVKESLLQHLLAGYTTQSAAVLYGDIQVLARYIKANNIEEFFTAIKSIFAGIPSHIFINEREAYYHTVIYIVLKLLGITVNPEEHTNLGRIDNVIETASNIYVMEFKMNSAQDALDQIKEKKYYEKYLNHKKKIILMGISFDAETRNIGEYLIEKL
ncbi:MAG: ATP-binding protein [bacterium]|nr:ATP-binding protein [bacterium]